MRGFSFVAEPLTVRGRIARRSGRCRAACGAKAVLPERVTILRFRMSWAEAETASSIPERFEYQVHRSPDRTAIAGSGLPLTYGDVDALANRYAEAILRQRPERDGSGAAALLLSHGALVIIGALGALKAGMAVVVLNPT